MTQRAPSSLACLPLLIAFFAWAPLAMAATPTPEEACAKTQGDKDPGQCLFVMQALSSALSEADWKVFSACIMQFDPLTEANAEGCLTPEYKATLRAFLDKPATTPEPKPPETPPQTPPEALSPFTAATVALVDTTCACQDMGCATNAANLYNETIKDMTPSPSPAEASILSAATERLGPCLTAIASKPTP
jgi:hypothetical protein